MLSSSQTAKRAIVDRTALVCQEASLIGEITVGAGCVLHPKCRIIAETAPIILGRNNIIEENAVIINKGPSPLLIGDENIFEVASKIEASRVGHQNIFEARSHVRTATMIGSNCVIGQASQTGEAEQIPDKTVIYGSRLDRRVQHMNDAHHINLHARHLEYLREILPKYNHLRPSGQV
ncbi:trimeric LpxA-like protein [Piptocephalis cylindrospora]|uniref:Dynactin subunit 6 n=1 Tax=Piptocephalis cylindrospora TaxID=1907219 RepID=A0A4P9XYZ3_9FUNG|nr:trimeric LpxA-like protein [Piptocephalis cylindrospora]|eukprot:RKP11676.1 trimeric LpxA-like protein [Piptocephalis cylindrospora]